MQTKIKPHDLVKKGAIEKEKLTTNKKTTVMDKESEKT